MTPAKARRAKARRAGAALDALAHAVTDRAAVTPPPCKCSHIKSMHYRDRRGRPTCGSAACGCIEYRAREEPPAGAA